MTTPPGRVRAAIRQPAHQPDIAPGQVIPERQETNRRRTRIRLRRGVHPDPLHAVGRPHRLVRIPERQFPDQALVPGPRRPLVQRSDRPPPRRHRHRLLRIAVQPCTLERSQIRGIALPDALTPAGLLKEPAEHRDVTGISTDTAGRTHPPGVQLAEKAVQLHVIRPVRPPRTPDAHEPPRRPAPQRPPSPHQGPAPTPHEPPRSPEARPRPAAVRAAAIPAIHPVPPSETVNAIA